MADYYRHFCVAVRLQRAVAGAWVADTMRARRRQWQQLVADGYHDAADEIGIDFDWEIDADGYIVISDDSGASNVAHAAEFLRELMKLGYILEPVAVQWAETCSRSTPDAFTGGAAIVTRRRVQWIAVPEIVERRLRAIERRSRKAA